MKKHIFIVLAFICVLLGTIGIFLPLLPTTPFLLLATYLFMNSSKTRLKWLLKNRYLGPYIKSYLSKEGISLRLKIRTVTLLWMTILFSAFYATDKLHVRAILLIIAVLVTIHITSKKTKRGSV